jgi:hypothetical protein
MRHYDGSSKLLQTMFLCFYIVYSRMYSNIFSKKIYSEHKALLKRTSAQGIAKRHIEHFVGWFEYKVSIVIIYLTKKYCSCPLFKYFISFFLERRLMYFMKNRRSVKSYMTFHRVPIMWLGFSADA